MAFGGKDEGYLVLQGEETVVQQYDHTHPGQVGGKPRAQDF
jgi:hypothetical protein